MHDDKNKRKRDTISPEVFRDQMAGLPTLPEEDSPGDSEVDAGAEFMAGLNYMPDEKNELAGDEDEPGEIVFSDRQSKIPEEISRKVINVPETAKMVSSEQPAPWADLDLPSETH